jgi:elongation factor 1 alpha-like protein
MGYKQFVGQTCEHLNIIKSMGITEIIVAVNKLDMITNEKEKFKKIKKAIRKKLKKYSIKRKFCKFIPISGLKGTNLTKKGY